MTLVRTKLTHPAPVGGAVDRPRLAQAIAGTDKQITLISAPAGYGKTTIVAQSFAANSSVAWLRIDRADNDPVRFWTHLGGALVDAGKIDEETLDDIVDQLESNRLQDAIDDLAAAIDDHATAAVLVIDDVHEVVNPVILEPLGDILSRPPLSLRIVLVTRADPALPLGRLRAQDSLFELRASDLAFTADEALGVLGDLADVTSIEPVLERTHGWVTALRMFAVAADEPHELTALLAASGTADLTSFLSGEVLQRQPPDVQSFLIETSILDDLIPELCDSVTGRQDSLSTLRHLVRSHIFTENVTNTTFRYHPLFSEFLRSHFQERTESERQQAHARAARWLRENDDSSAAISHYLVAGDRDAAVEQIRASWVTYAQQGLWATIEGWLSDYGVTEARLDEDLCLAAAWLALNARRYDTIDRWIDDQPDASVNFQIQAAALRSYRARHLGDLDAAVDHGQRSVDLLTKDPGAPSASTALTAHGTAQALVGNNDTTAFERALELGHTKGMVTSVVESCSFLALLASNDPDTHDLAVKYIDTALELTTEPADERFHQPAAAWLAAARVARHRGRLADAAQAATRALNIANDALDPALQILIECEQAHIAQAQGDNTSARAAYRRASRLLQPTSGEYLPNQVRITGNAIRYAELPVDANLPIGALELTERERAILRNLDNNLSRAELAKQLYISENTLKSHLSSIGRKLGVRKRRDIISRAKELNLI